MGHSSQLSHLARVLPSFLKISLTGIELCVFYLLTPLSFDPYSGTLSLDLPDFLSLANVSVRFLIGVL